MKNIDSKGHVTGKSIYVDDIPVRQNTLYAAVLDATVAHGKICSLEITEAEKHPGVVRIFTFKDIPGENQIGGIIPDETLLAEDEVVFQGEPIAVVVAESEYIAREARRKIKVSYEVLEIVTDPREAAEKGMLLMPSRTFAMGNPEKRWKDCRYVFDGKADIGGQEHLYLETQGTYCFPLENGNLMVYSSTQSPTAVQRAIAKVLGVSMHNIQVDVTRLGGGFGGKEDQATVWACLASLASYHLQKPVKLMLSRHDDMRMTGKRHPYSSDFKIGLSEDLRILAYEVNYYQNGGAANDLSPAISERTLFHTTNSYFIPDIKATLYSCKTNLPPNTAFRGFGAPQGIFAIESAIAKAAKELGVPAGTIQEKNLLKENDYFYYGQKAERVNIGKAWKAAFREFKITQKQKEVDAFNRENRFVKKGLALMPVTFGISFTNTMLNQARALVHVYTDGSVGISTGAIEMGQGVNTKMVQVTAQAFGIAPERIKMESTNTTRVANTSPTAASTGADLNGQAVLTACNAIVQRLKKVAAELNGVRPGAIELRNEQIFAGGREIKIRWEQLVTEAYSRRVKLSETGHYSTPVICFDKEKGKGHPFAYHVYGTAVVTAKVDCLRGIYEIEEMQIIHDFGKSINPIIDTGQVEGAVVQGIGYMTMEEVAYDNSGKLLANSLSVYKIPDIYSVPKVLVVKPLKVAGHKLAVLKSKAVGEPPLMYGLGAYFAIQNAVRTFNPGFDAFDAPITPEKVLMGLYGKTNIQ
ncbi:MAG: xanthine dehydrogenase molybdopterin binding subunit [bacterium]|nr:MAG: xanthine dehydrogenase molybdopterin binding subunit [bacterium]